MPDATDPAAPPAPINVQQLHDDWTAAQQLALEVAAQGEARLKALQAEIAAEVAAADARLKAAHDALVANMPPLAVFSTTPDAPPVTVVVGGQAVKTVPHFLGNPYTPPVVAGQPGAGG